MPTFKLFDKSSNDLQNMQFAEDIKTLRDKPFELVSLHPTSVKKLSRYFKYYENFVSVELEADLGQKLLKLDSKTFEAVAKNERRIHGLRKFMNERLHKGRAMFVTQNNNNSEEKENSKHKMPLHTKFSHFPSEYLLRLDKCFFKIIENYIDESLNELAEKQNIYKARHRRLNQALLNYQQYLENLREQVNGEKKLLAKHMLTRMQLATSDLTSLHDSLAKFFPRNVGLEAQKEYDIQNGDLLVSLLKEDMQLFKKEEFKPTCEHPQRDLTASVFTEFYLFITSIKNNVSAIFNQLQRLWEKSGSLRLTNKNSLQAIPIGINPNLVPLVLGKWGWFSRGTNTVYDVFSQWNNIIQQDLTYQKIKHCRIKQPGEELPRDFQAQDINDENSIFTQTRKLTTELSNEIEKLKVTQRELNKYFYKTSRSTLQKWQILLEKRLKEILILQIEFYEKLQHKTNLRMLKNSQGLYQKTKDLYVDIGIQLLGLPDTKVLQKRLEDAKNNLKKHYKKSLSLTVRFAHIEIPTARDVETKTEKKTTDINILKQQTGAVIEKTQRQVIVNQFMKDMNNELFSNQNQTIFESMCLDLKKERVLQLLTLNELSSGIQTAYKTFIAKLEERCKLETVEPLYHRQAQVLISILKACTALPTQQEEAQNDCLQKFDIYQRFLTTHKLVAIRNRATSQPLSPVNNLTPLPIGGNRHV